MMKDNTESGDNGDNNPEEMGNIYISSEQIIQEVQKFRCLYDPADPDHKDRDVVRDAWLSVTQAVVGEPWASMNTAEKDEAADNVEKKWKNLRELIRESLKNPARRTRKPGMFYDDLNPLSEAENSRSFSEADDTAADQGADEQTVPSSSRSERNLRPKRNTSVIDYMDDSPFEVDDFSDASDPPPVTPSPKRKKNKPQQIAQTTPGFNSFGREHSGVFECTPELSSFPGVNYPSPQSVCMPEPDNPDRMFLLSLLPRLSALNGRNKLDFQIKAMQMLRGYEKDDTN